MEDCHLPYPAKIIAAVAALTLFASPGASQDRDPSQDRDTEGVYAESGFRLPLPRRENLDPEGQKSFDTLTRADTDPRRGSSGPGVGLKGPAGIMLHSPRYAELASPMNSFLRFESGLDSRTRELAILVVAREAGNAFEWAAHEPIARREGIAPRVIEAVRDRSDTASLDERDAVIIELGRQAITAHSVPRATFDRALELFGPKTLVNLVGLMGNYLSTAVMLTVFGMKTPADGAPMFPSAARPRRSGP